MEHKDGTLVRLAIFGKNGLVTTIIGYVAHEQKKIIDNDTVVLLKSGILKHHGLDASLKIPYYTLDV